MQIRLTLCESCRWKRDIVSGTGSRFLLCELSLTDKRFSKYPPQPVVQCRGYASVDRTSAGAD